MEAESCTLMRHNSARCSAEGKPLAFVSLMQQAMLRRRFRYRPVPKQTYGLDIVDLLQLDAKELNQACSAAARHSVNILMLLLTGA